MKPIFLSLCVLIFSNTFSIAQSSAELQANFATNLSKFQKHTESGDKAYEADFNNLISIMEQEVSITKGQIAAPGSDRMRLNENLKNELNILKRTVELGREDKVKNRNAIKVEMESFMQYL